MVVDAREGAIELRGLATNAAMTALATEHDDPVVTDGLGSVGRAAVLVMTHDHGLDQDIVEWALRQGFAFVGGVGSRAKAAKTRQRLEAKGFVSADVARVRMPLGLDIEARSPAEIAVAIAGELVQWRARLLGRTRRERQPIP